MIRLRMLTKTEREFRKYQRLSHWHKWFAWKPVRLTCDRHEIRFLGFIYRKGRSVNGHEGESWWIWEYAETSFDVLKIDRDEINEG